MTDQVFSVCPTVMPKYSLTSQKPASLTCEKNSEPQPMASAEGATWGRSRSAASGATMPAAVMVATVADPVASRMPTATSQPSSSADRFASLANWPTISKAGRRRTAGPRSSSGLETPAAPAAPGPDEPETRPAASAAPPDPACTSSGWALATSSGGGARTTYRLMRLPNTGPATITVGIATSRPKASVRPRPATMPSSPDPRMSARNGWTLPQLMRATTAAMPISTAAVSCASPEAGTIGSGVAARNTVHSWSEGSGDVRGGAVDDHRIVRRHDGP